jgi:hypothetical protein
LSLSTERIFRLVDIVFTVNSLEDSSQCLNSKSTW